MLRFFQYMAQSAWSLNNDFSWFLRWPFKPAFRQHQAVNFICLCLCICLCIWWFAPVSPAVQRHIMRTSCQAATCSTPHPPNPCVTLCDCGRAANILPLPFNQFPTSNPSSLIPEVPNNPGHPTHWSYLLPRQTPRLWFKPHTYFHLHRKLNYKRIRNVAHVDSDSCCAEHCLEMESYTFQTAFVKMHRHHDWQPMAANQKLHQLLGLAASNQVQISYLLQLMQN